MFRLPFAAGVSLSASLILAASPATAGFRVLPSASETIELEFTLPPLRVELVTVDGTAYVRVDGEGCGVGGAIGEPRLPVPRRLLEMPTGTSWSVEVEELRLRELPLAALVLPRQAVCYGDAPPSPFVRSGEAYARTGYPRDPGATLDEAGLVRQHRLALLSVDAVQYDPAGQRLRLLDRARIRIRLHPDGPPMAAAEAERLRSPVFDALLSRLVANAPPARYYPPGPVGMIVVSAPQFFDDPELAAFVEWKVRRGLQVTHVSTDQIGGLATQIQDYIMNAYWTWDVPPTFVLLVGDTPAIPHWPGQGYLSPPTDLYYAVTGGPGIYLPDLALGRFAVADTDQLHNILRKTLSYEQAAWTGDDAWVKYATFMAGNDHWGDHENQCNVVIDAFLSPRSYQYDRLFCHTYDAISQQVSDAFNDGRSLGMYTGHGDVLWWADGPVFFQANVRALTNTVYPLIQSYSCLTGKFNHAECLGETWIRAEHAAIGFFGSSTLSATLLDNILSWHFNEGIFDGPAHGMINQTWMGGAAFYSKIAFYEHEGDNIGTQGYLEQYNLLGDPSLDLWTEVPVPVPASAPDFVVAGATGVEISAPGVAFGLATAAGRAGGEDFVATAWTDSVGHAALTFPAPVEPGTLRLALIAHNRIPWFAEAVVIPSSGPFLRADSCLVLDAGGDADGEPDAGETVELSVTLENIGFAPALALSAILSSPDPSVTILSAPSGYPDIAPGGTSENSPPFVVRLAPDSPDQYAVPLTVTVDGEMGHWVCDFTITAQGPTLESVAELIDDSFPPGDGDGVADPGEMLSLYLWLENRGRAAAPPTTGRLTSLDPSVLVLQESAPCAGIPPGERRLAGAFQLFLYPACPAPATLPLELSLSAPGGYEALVAHGMPVGAWFDDLETDRGWQVGAVGDDAVAGIWLRANPRGTAVDGKPVQPEQDHTPNPASICFVTGNGLTGQPAQYSDVDGGSTTLTTPVFALADASSATVEYWRWYTNDLGPNPGEDFWDVDVTADGEVWVSLEHTTEGATEWTRMVFDLADYIPLTDQVRIRFVARDQLSESLVEAAVDDFTLTMVRRLPAGTPDEPGALGTGLLSVGPNPAGRDTRIAYQCVGRMPIRLALHDVLGRRIRTLVTGMVEPGTHTAVFDGRNDQGREVPSGVYFLNFEAPEWRQSRRIIILR